MAGSPTITSEAQDDRTNALVAALDSSDEGDEVDESAGEKSEEGATETTTDETPTEGEGEEAEEEGKTEEDSSENIFNPEEENRELRQLLRSQKREIAIMKSKIERLSNRKTQSPSPQKTTQSSYEEDLFGEGEGEKSPESEQLPEKEQEEELSPLESAQLRIQQIAEARGPILDALVEAMELNPKYGDVAEVCSQSNFEDMFEYMGQAIAKDKGVDPVLAAAEAEATVWAMRNPYRFMYDLIKKHHPTYKANSEGAKTKKATPDKATTPDKKEPVKAPSSIAGVPGKSVADNAWTAARIDEMDETELTEVPPKIYDKYLRGELD